MSTELLTPDNQLITIPNKLVWGSSIVNMTRMPTRRASDVGISYNSDLESCQNSPGPYEGYSVLQTRNLSGYYRACEFFRKFAAQGMGKTWDLMAVKIILLPELRLQKRRN